MLRDKSLIKKEINTLDLLKVKTPSGFGQCHTEISKRISMFGSQLYKLSSRPEEINKKILIIKLNEAN